MIWLLLILVIGIILGMLDNNLTDEYNAMAYVGPDEFNKAKNSMSKKEFKAYVEKNSKLMKKAESNAAEYYRNKK